MQVLSGACAEAANQLTEWARQLEASKSTLMIPDALTALLDPATYARIQTLSDVADFWMAIAPAIQGLLVQPEAPSGPAIQAVSAFLTVSSLTSALPCAWCWQSVAVLQQPHAVLALTLHHILGAMPS